MLGKILKYDKKIITGIFVGLLLLLFAHNYLVGFSIYSDGIGYYSYERSIFIDNDLNFENEYVFYNTSFSKLSDVPRGINLYPVKITPVGNIANIYPIGTAILMSPFFLLAHILTILLATLGFNILANGYTYFYEIFNGIGMLFFTYIGTLFLYENLKLFFEKKIAFLSTLTMFLSTGLVWYSALEPNSHVISYFLINLTIFMWLQKKWFLTGLFGGLIFLTRLQDVLILIVPLIYSLVSYYRELKVKNWNNIFSLLKKNLLLVFGFVIPIPIQLLTYKIMYGSFLVDSYMYSERYFWEFFSPKILALLVSFEGGFIRIPMIILGVVGLFLFLKNHKTLAASFLIIFFLQYYVVSAWSETFSGYYLRFFIGISIVFAFGLAEIYKRIKLTYIMWIFMVSLIINFLNLILYLF